MIQKSKRPNGNDARRTIMSDLSAPIRSQDDPTTSLDRLLYGVFGAVLFGCVYYLCYIAIGVLNQ